MTTEGTESTEFSYVAVRHVTSVVNSALLFLLISSCSRVFEKRLCSLDICHLRRDALVNGLQNGGDLELAGEKGRCA